MKSGRFPIRRSMWLQCSCMNYSSVSLVCIDITVCSTNPQQNQSPLTITINHQIGRKRYILFTMSISSFFSIRSPCCRSYNTDSQTTALLNKHSFHMVKYKLHQLNVVCDVVYYIHSQVYVVPYQQTHQHSSYSSFIVHTMLGQDTKYFTFSNICIPFSNVVYITPCYHRVLYTILIKLKCF